MQCGGTPCKYALLLYVCEEVVCFLVLTVPRWHFKVAAGHGCLLGSACAAMWAGVRSLADCCVADDPFGHPSCAANICTLA